MLSLLAQPQSSGKVKKNYQAHIFNVNGFQFTLIDKNKIIELFKDLFHYMKSSFPKRLRDHIFQNGLFY